MSDEKLWRKLKRIEKKLRKRTRRRGRLRSSSPSSSESIIQLDEEKTPEGVIEEEHAGIF